MFNIPVGGCWNLTLDPMIFENLPLWSHWYSKISTHSQLTLFNLNWMVALDEETHWNVSNLLWGEHHCYLGRKLVSTGEIMIRRQTEDNWRTTELLRIRTRFYGQFLIDCGVLVAIFQSILGLPWIFLPSSGWPLPDLGTWLNSLVFRILKKKKGMNIFE